MWSVRWSWATTISPGCRASRWCGRSGARERARLFEQEREVPGTPWRLGAIGVAEWAGVRLREILERAGLKFRDQVQGRLRVVRLHGRDASMLTRCECRRGAFLEEVRPLFDSHGASHPNGDDDNALDGELTA